MPRVFEQYLEGLIAEINAAMREALAAAIATAPDADHPLVGRIYRTVPAYLEGGGKRMHGSAVVLAFGAVGGAPRRAILPVAAGFQLYHHHTLVHDDIYDEDGERRGAPTIHRAFTDWFAARAPAAAPAARAPAAGRVFLGASERQGAIAGWAQGKVVHALAFEAICGAAFPPDRLLAAARALNWHDVHDNAGQAKDVFHEGAEIPEPEACVEISRLKTGRLFAVAAEAGAHLGGGTPSQARAVVGWVVPSAIAYQLQDDLEDLEKDSEKGRGRGIGSDLRTCKPTLILSLALRQASPAGKRLLEDWIRQPPPRTGDVQPIVEVIRDSGAVDACRARVQALVDESIRALQTAEPALEPAHVERMAGFTRYFVSREYWKRPLAPGRHPLEPGP